MNQTVKTNQATENKKDVFVTVYLSDILKGLRKFWWVCVAAAVLLSGYKVINEKINYVPEYTSSATLTVNTQHADTSIGGVSVYTFYYDSTTASLLSSTFPFILSCNLLQDAICEDLDIPAVPVSLKAEAVPGSNMFTLTAKGKDPQITYDVLISAIKNYPSVAKHVVGNIEFDILKQPFVATSPSNDTDYFSEAVKGAIIGVFFGLLFILVYVLQRKTVKTKNDIQNSLNLEPLAVVPQVIYKKRAMPGDKSLLFTNSDIGSGFPESFRVLRNIFTSSVKENEKIIMATSSVPGEGKTTIVTNLALALADQGKRIILVDADIRHPSIAPLLGIDPESIEYETVTDLYKIASLEKFKIHLLSPIAGEESEEGPGYFNSGNIKKMFEELKNEYDYILVDTPPCGLISDAMFIAQYADAAIFVVYQDAVRISRVKSTLDNLMSTDIRILGCVLNGTISGLSGYGYGYGYSGYGYGYGYGKYGYGYKYGYGHSEEHKRRKKIYHRNSKQTETKQ